MARAAINTVMQNLMRKPESYSDLIRGKANDELHQLRNELDQLRSLLQESEKQAKKEEPFRKIERQIIEVVYDVEDTIDLFLVQEEAATKAVHDLVRPGRGTAFLGRRRGVDLADLIASLRINKVKPMLDMTSEQLASMPTADASHKFTGTAVKKAINTNRVQTIKKDDVVNLPDEEERIIELLMREAEQLGIVAIIGQGGLGKTTMARNVFESQSVRYEFPTRIWVDIDQDPKRKDMLLNIMKGLTDEDMSSLSELQLAEMVRAGLKERKFLLVLDDVWSLEDWDKIQIILPRRNKNGRVLITTRHYRVGKYASVTDEPHWLGCMTEDQSWYLFQRIVFKDLNACPKHLENIGKHIVRQCGGHPLSIMMIGGTIVGLLSELWDENLDRWEEIARVVRSRLVDDIGARFSNILEWSYNNLPDHLRDCFVYLGVFPRDYEIPIWKLTQLWIAEGLIQQQQEEEEDKDLMMSLEEIAMSNLQELMHRSLVMIRKTNSNGEAKTCRVHDEIREFCTMKGKDHNFFQEINFTEKGVLLSDVSEETAHRRLCLHSNAMRFISSAPDSPHIRTFLHFSGEETILPPEDNSSIAEAFKLLRVLDVKPIKFTRFPFSTTRPINLRHLALSSEFKVLPEVLSDMGEIRTLVVQTTFRTMDFEADIWKMTQLRHVKTNASITLLKTGSEGNKCSNLQTLAYIAPQSCMNVCKSARNLKRLGIRGRLVTLLDSKDETCPFDYLRYLRHLEKLKLVNDVYPDPLSQGQLPGLPPPDKFPPNLTILTLSGTYLHWYQMSVIGMLETLKVLKLKNHAFEGVRWEVFDGGFKKLEVLQLEYTNLVHWKASSAHFPELQCLGIRNCEKLEGLPLGLSDIESLRVIDLHRTTKSAVASAREIERAILHREGRSTRNFQLSVFPPNGRI